MLVFDERGKTEFLYLEYIPNDLRSFSVSLNKKDSYHV